MKWKSGQLGEAPGDVEQLRAAKQRRAEIERVTLRSGKTNAGPRRAGEVPALSLHVDPELEFGEGADTQEFSDRMDAAEYANIAALEAEHWYYAGKREFVRQWIERVRPPSPTDVLLDCGAGTGRFAEEMQARCRVMVLDDHEESLRILRTRFRDDQILSLAGDRVPLPDDALEYVTALDVLEHVPDDAAVVQGFHRLLKPGGLAVVTVPASMALWSDWDVALHHFRRYNRPQLRALFPAAGWDVVHVNYTNVLVYPAVWCVRKWRAFRGPAPVPTRANGAAVRSEDKIPSPWLNRLLRTTFVGMARSRMPYPFGVSLLLVARRRG